MGIFNFIYKKEDLILVDIGSSTIKALEISNASSEPEIINVAVAQVTETIFGNNLIEKTEYVAQKIKTLLDENGFGDKRVATFLPGPTVFTKIVKMQKMDPAQLETSLQYEAARFLHDSHSSVKVDYHVMNDLGSSLEILVVVVKNNIQDSFINCFAGAGLPVAILDVDYFSLQNCYETVFPDDINQTTCLINMGARYSSVNIVRGGNTLYSGSIAVGGNLFTTAISTALGVDMSDAERIKKGDVSQSFSSEKVEEVLKDKVDLVATDFNRQLGLFWNSAGIDGGIDKIMVSGGGSLTPGLIKKVQDKTGIDTALFEFSEQIKISEKFDKKTFRELSPILACMYGLATRKAGDKDKLDYL